MKFEAFQSQYASSLTSQQLAALRAVEGNVLLLAVPGSGKTTVLVLRLGYMIRCCGIDPRRILTMTYTVAAARDMKARYSAIFGEEPALEFRTINGVCARIIRMYEQRYQRTAFSLMTEEGEAAALAREVWRQVMGDFPTDSDIKGLQTAIAYVKNEMLTQEQIGEMDKKVEKFSALYRTYQEALRKSARMDYDDQMVYALQILRRCPEILQELRSRWSYLCVDEAQDTSRIQHTIIDLLSSGNLFMVGDEDQSIYGFRAACPEAILTFERRHSGAKVLLMEQNFRSTQSIVKAADGFIRLNTQRRSKTMTAARQETGAAVREIPVRDRRSQYRYLLKVAESCGKETAVLYRDNDCALPLIDLMERRGIPYRSRQTDMTFFSNRVTRDLTDILRLCLDPGDGETFLRLYYKFGAGITRQAAEYACAHCPREESLFAFVSRVEGLSDYARVKARSLHTHLEHMRSERGDKAVYRIMHFMGYGDYLAERGGDSARAEILEALGEQEASPARLLERLEELREILQRGAAADAPFILSTVHSAKGLEYDTVYLMDAVDGILPKEGEDTDTEEERRLFYVAMTRAKQELYIFTMERSSFAQTLFPRQEVRAIPKAVSARRRETPKSMIPPEAFYPGREVMHKVFGPGTVAAREGDVLTINLEDNTKKRLLLSAALGSGVLSIR